MPSAPDTGPTRPAVSPLDHRVEAATGHTVDLLWSYRDRGVLDEAHALLVDRHRKLAQAQTGVIFYRTLLHRLSSGEFDIDSALFERIDRTVDQLEEAANARDDAAARVLQALEPIESAELSALPGGREPLPAADRAALLAIAGGAKLHEHLLTNRRSVATASGTRIPHDHLERLEASGLVTRDTSHAVHAGQPVALTDTGRAALVSSQRPSTTATPSMPPPGTWPATARGRR
ncbi:hypothetical protein ACIO3O_08250 [Streptomyces sp. NPDC087440]|uniref:hypothetical protein n=1 Tax=Streptomyces sp. NPDC087440 TaxID=3365790 RepID=UPI00381C7E66